MKKWFLVMIALVVTPVIAKKAPDIEYFSKNDQYKQIKVAPDGKHLAVKMPFDGKDALAILNTETLKPTYVIRFSGQKQVGEYYWANDERLIMKIELFKGWFEHPVSYQEWFAVNLDGKKNKKIFGYSAGEMQTGSHIKKQQSLFAWGTLVDLLPKDNEHVLMMATPMARKANQIPTLYRLNIYNGKTKTLGNSPTRMAQFLADHDGKARFVSGSNSKGIIELFYRDSESRDWTQLDFGNEYDGSFLPIAFADKDSVYIADNRDSSTTGVFRLDMKTGNRELVYRDDEVDPSKYYFSADRRKLYALEVQPDTPSYVFVDPNHPEAKLLKSLMAAFPGKQVRLDSSTANAEVAVVRVFDDQDPGQFYLYEAKKNAVRYLVSKRSWVEPALAAEVSPIKFKARDGVEIHGYLTLPTGKEAKNLPLVVNPHGGPHGVRDWWGYNDEIQLLASRGMAVLQVNFRGSGGYGRDFEAAGYQRWGSDIQYDIIDATKYVTEQGIADKNRVCVYGTSFGGYSALQSAILQPELFACSVGFVGVYDLELLYNSGDIPKYLGGRKFLERVVGLDKDNLEQFSPIHNVDKLKAPVLIIHGGKDERAPIEHAEKLRDALKAKGHPYEWMVMDDEGHGFYNEQNRKEMYETLLGFLEEHLKL